MDYDQKYDDISPVDSPSQVETNIQYDEEFLNELINSLNQVESESVNQVQPDLQHCQDLDMLEMPTESVVREIEPDLRQCQDLDMLEIPTESAVREIQPDLQQCQDLDMLEMCTESVVREIQPDIQQCQDLSQIKPNKVVTALGKRYVYKRTYADRGETTTVLGCICDDGSFIPPLVIFKGVRWNPDLARGAIPNTIIKLSPKGWINSDIFLEWFQFFINSVPQERPLILLMDSHASHLSLAVLELAKQNDLHLFTFPAHTSHLLQPLDVGVYRPLKSAWTNCLNDHMKEKNDEKPSRYYFNELFAVAMIKSFTPNSIEHVRKSGISSLNKEAILSEAIAPSKLTETRLNDQSITKNEYLVPSDPLLEKFSADNFFTAFCKFGQQSNTTD
ncbi:uncharacterized protein LOC115886237 [Sitophilus oryzae]|uniref:Uncharacterized protein LOC115886237 n=1 Tax=Sitophilus oryzae TaxID=7048 RepID=A0A6J2YE76_SITOR|nr:uncharacterized protein LOC115886237 [Sitophilus oryzae]